MKKLSVISILCLVSLSGYASHVKQADNGDIASLATGNVVIKANKAIIYKNDKGIKTAIFPKGNNLIKVESNNITNLTQSQLNKYQ